ncbi:hypothetical protein D3C78_1263280 [compost metagenome]
MIRRMDVNIPLHLLLLMMDCPCPRSDMGLPHILIQQAGLKQFLMTACMSYASMIHDNDLICISYRRQSVRDDQQGFTFGERTDGPLQLVFIFRICEGGRFIQNYNRRIFQNGSGD